MNLNENYVDDGCVCGDDLFGCEECNVNWEDEESVANGAGFTINDDGHWVPVD